MSQGRVGDFRVLPQKIFGLNGVKSCNFRRNKHGNSTFINKARDSVYDGRRDNPFELGGDSNFSNFKTMLNTGERSEPENNYKNKIKISGGGGSGLPVPPPSGSAHAKYKAFSYFPATITCITK